MITANPPVPLHRISLLRFFLAVGSVVCGLQPLATHAQELAPRIDQTHPVLVAARTGRTAEVIAELERGLSVNVCTEWGQTLLSVALEGRQFETAREIVRRGFKPTLTFKSGNTGEYTGIGDSALSAAAERGVEDIVDELLQRGSTAYPMLFARSPFVTVPVFAAIKSDKPRMLKSLLASVPRERAADEVRKHSYEYLAACQSIAVLDVLAEYPLDLEQTAQGEPFQRVLHAYARRGWPEGVAKLLQLGADPTQPIDRTRTLPEDVAATPKLRKALQAAALRTRAERAQAEGSTPAFPVALFEAAIIDSETAAVEQLEHLQRPALEAKDDRGWTPLHYALHYRFIALTHALIDAGAPVAHLTTSGSSVVAFATLTDDLGLVRKLAAKGADVNAAEHGMSHPLIIATEKRQAPMVELLLSLGARVDGPKPRRQGARWQSSLMVACKAGDLALMERLLQAGGDVHAVDSSGEGLVHYAVRSGKPDILRWTLHHGAYLQLKTPHGTNALTLAASLGSLEMVKTLLALGVTHPDALAYAERSNSTETAEHLRRLKKQADANDPDLFWNRVDLSLEEIRHYAETGGDLNHGDRSPTPLQRMAELGHVEAVEFLLQKGADPRRRGSYTTPAVFWSLRHLGNNVRTDDTALALVRVFLAHGVSPNTRDYSQGLPEPETEPTGSWLLAQALDLGFLKTARYLLDQGADPHLVGGGYPGGDAFDALRRTHRIDDMARREFRLVMEEYARKLPAPAPTATPVPAPSRARLPIKF